MLNKLVCKLCINRFRVERASRVIVLTGTAKSWRWSDFDEREWQEGKVMCGALIMRSIGEIPEFCRFVVEHTVSAGVDQGDMCSLPE